MPADGNYRISAVVKGADIPPKELNRNIDRKIIKIAGPDPGKGHPRKFSLASVYEIAIGHLLIKSSVSPTVAMAFASKFREPQRGRKLGKLFESGKTLLLISDGVGSIINLQADQDVSTHLQDATIVVDIGTIVTTVNSRLLH